MILYLDIIVADQLAVLLGSIFGATGAALIPYWQTVRNNEALGLPPITFDKKFMGTLAMAFCIGIGAGFLYFNSVQAAINTTQTIITLFATAVIASAMSNRAINSSLAVSSTTTLAKNLQTQNTILTDEVNVLKVKVASFSHPLVRELIQTSGEAVGAPTIGFGVGRAGSEIVETTTTKPVHGEAPPVPLDTTTPPAAVGDAVETTTTLS